MDSAVLWSTVSALGAAAITAAAALMAAGGYPPSKSKRDDDRQAERARIERQLEDFRIVTGHWLEQLERDLDIIRDRRPRSTEQFDAVTEKFSREAYEAFVKGKLLGGQTATEEHAYTLRRLIRLKGEGPEVLTIGGHAAQAQAALRGYAAELRKTLAERPGAIRESRLKELSDAIEGVPGGASRVQPSDQTASDESKARPPGITG